MHAEARRFKFGNSTRAARLRACPMSSLMTTTCQNVKPSVNIVALAKLRLSWINFRLDAAVT